MSIVQRTHLKPLAASPPPVLGFPPLKELMRRKKQRKELPCPPSGGRWTWRWVSGSGADCEKGMRWQRRRRMVVILWAMPVSHWILIPKCNELVIILQGNKEDNWWDKHFMRVINQDRIDAKQGFTNYSFNSNRIALAAPGCTWPLPLSSTFIYFPPLSSRRSALVCFR